MRLSHTVIAALVALAAPDLSHAEPGASVYMRQCSVCHQDQGRGMVGSFPRLAGRAGEIAAIPKGRKMMLSAVLFGMSGKLQSDGQSIVGVMTAFPNLSDSDIAGVLNYIAHLDKKTPPRFTPDEVAAVRHGPPLTPTQVNALARDPALSQAAP